MVGAVLAAMMAMQPAAAPLSPSELPYDTRSCSAPLLKPDGSRLGGLAIYVDPDYRPLLTQIGFSLGSGYGERSARWRWPMQAGEPGAMTGFIYDLHLPWETIFPVTVTAYLDGELRWTRSFTEPTGGINFWTMEEIRSLPQTGPIERRVRSIRYIRIIAPRVHDFPDFSAARELRLRVQDADGDRVSDQAIALPGWRHLQRQADRAYVQAENLRRSRQCPTARLPPVS